MFNHKDLETIQSRICKLETTVNAMKQPLGEIYAEHRGVYSSYFGLSYVSNNITKYWQKFFSIDDQVNGKVKIEGLWFDKSDVIFYQDTDALQAKKDAIVKRINEKR